MGLATKSGWTIALRRYAEACAVLLLELYRCVFGNRLCDGQASKLRLVVVSFSRDDTETIVRVATMVEEL